MMRVVAVFAWFGVLWWTYATSRREPVAINRWRGRPVVAGALLVAGHGVPLVCAIAASAFLSRQLEEPTGFGATALQWGLLLTVSTIVLWLTDRVARRLLPLAALMKLSMVFPDRAPKRLAVARKAGSVKTLQQRLEEARALGRDDEPTRTAETILALVGALHAHDRHTRGHSERVRWFTDLLAEELKLAQHDRDRLRWAALLHDIGKLDVDGRILNKPGKPTPHEWSIIHRHPEEGARLASPLSSWLGEWADTIEQHHEKWDGTGYPHKLKGEEICLGARIVAVADAYEVMTAVRAYKKAMPASHARKELTASAGTHFDPAIVRAFLNVSIGRLRWVTGPVAWVAQLPFIGWLPRIAEGVAAAPAAGLLGTAAGVAAITQPAVEPAPPVAEEAPLEVTVDTAGIEGLLTPLTTAPTVVLGKVIDRSTASATPDAAPPMVENAGDLVSGESQVSPSAQAETPPQANNDETPAAAQSPGQASQASDTQVDSDKGKPVLDSGPSVPATPATEKKALGR